jgi:mannose-6-phosphate isomerase-like protein (cupin superfamily)
MNLKEKLSEITEYYAPKIVGEVNDVFIKLVKVNGNKVPWHTHDNEDELFYIISGSQTKNIRTIQNRKWSINLCSNPFSN